VDAQAWRELGAMALALAFLGWVVMRRRVLRVPAHHVVVVERLGRYRRTASAGVHVLWPIDSARPRLEMRERTHVMRREPVQTADGTWLTARITIRYRITDPVRWTYEVSDPLYAIGQLAMTMLRSELSAIDLSRAGDERPAIASRVREEVRQHAPVWGAELIDLDVDEFDEPTTEPAPPGDLAPMIVRAPAIEPGGTEAS
jgi:regulator of protease activity HflC (stomatin/prohibitin superfamily)